MTHHTRLRSDDLRGGEEIPPKPCSNAVNGVRCGFWSQWQHYCEERLNDTFIACLQGARHPCS